MEKVSARLIFSTKVEYASIVFPQKKTYNTSERGIKASADLPEAIQKYLCGGGTSMKELKIGRVLFENRHRKGITQEELAEHLGVSKASVSKWETGDSLR